LFGNQLKKSIKHKKQQNIPMTIMQIFDSKAKGNLLQYILQCAIAWIAIAAVLLFFDYTSRIGENITIIASLGSSAFVLFALPQIKSAMPRRFVGGYIVALSLGVLFHFFAIHTLSNGNFQQGPILVFFGASVVALTILVMVLTNTEHAPAVGAAFAIILSGWNSTTLVFVMLSVVTMSAVHHLLRNKLKNLS